MSRARDDRKKNDRLHYAAERGWPLPGRAVITYAARVYRALTRDNKAMQA